jgi:predicted esterase
MTREDRHAEIADYVAYLDRALATVAPAASDVTVLGFSQGVATACRWVALGSTPIQRLILWAGPTPPDLDLTLLADRLRGAPVDVVVGMQDPISEVGSLERQLETLMQAGIESRLTRFEGAHQIDAGVLAQFASAA